MPDDILFRRRYRIPSARLPGWDYRWAGVYHVTICTQGRMQCLGDVVDGKVSLSPIGKVVAEKWLKIPTYHPQIALDEWIVMPDHMHGILIFQGPMQENESLDIVIGRFKAACTKRIWRHFNRRDFDWQERFYDNILRDLADLERVRAYIRNNPANWKP
ncbi:MAG TPA: transposase [Thermoanaerobaculia bacterium]|nr:transposase [Thermoanaerobaculia bacterium]